MGVWLRTFVACHIVAAACLCCCAACNIVGATWCCRCCCCWRCFLFDSAYKCCNVQLLNSSAAAATFKWLRLPQKLCAFVPLKCNPQIVHNLEKKLCHILGAAETKQIPTKNGYIKILADFAEKYFDKGISFGQHFDTKGCALPIYLEITLI